MADGLESGKKAAISSEATWIPISVSLWTYYVNHSSGAPINHASHNTYFDPLMAVSDTFIGVLKPTLRARVSDALRYST